MNTQSPPSQPRLRIPNGYSLIEGPDNQSVLVPTFMVPATKMAMEVEVARMAVQADNAAPGPPPYSNQPWQGIAEGLVHIPADPVGGPYAASIPCSPRHKPFSDREALNLHAEVKALQATLGLSYKDAAHHLYMTEVEKMKLEKQAELAFTKIWETIDNTIINEIYPPITKIDVGDFDHEGAACPGIEM
ncbi:hypothetical protein BYT27DRAFT_7207022 [Phlegmacium glaucopus]|nr:hypothetical protein BYT27DRAFT_7207022 [Phlegmacium glaucopus]